MDVLSFVNMKGGVAKTTLAVNVADALARRYDLSVLLVDLDPQFNATQCLMSGDEYVAAREAGEHTIVDVFTDEPRVVVDPVKGSTTREPVPLEDIEPVKIKPNFDLVLGDLELYRLEFAAGQGRELRLNNLIQIFANDDAYDIVIIDTPPTPSAWMTSALRASTHYLIPVKPDPISRTGIDLLKGVVNRVSKNFAHNIDCLGVVITMSDLRTRVYKETIAFFDDDKNWKDKRFERSLPQRTEIAREQGHQRLILDIKDYTAKSALVNIAKEILLRLGYEL